MLAKLQPLDDFRGARDLSGPADRQRELTRRAHGFRERFLSEPQVLFYRSFALVRVPYPSRYGFLNAEKVVSPYLHIVNRLFVVQFRDRSDGGTPSGFPPSPSGGAVKTLLFSPSDVPRNAETPFFKELTARFGPFQQLGRKLLGPTVGSVEESLRAVGIRPEAVDYLSYDHLHTQDLRRWLGDGGLLPNARLLVMRQEWESARSLLPTQRIWYCPGGLDGIDPSRVVLLDGDVRLGEGVALIRTPGHTEGNHSLVARTPEGIMVTSENGIGPDAYAPLASAIPGLARYAQRTGSDVILNGNTLEGSIDQYLSMVVEREIAGRSTRNPDFYNVVTSSELDAWWAFPGIRPTFQFGDLSFGAPVV